MEFNFDTNKSINKQLEEIGVKCFLKLSLEIVVLIIEYQDKNIDLEEISKSENYEKLMEFSILNSITDYKELYKKYNGEYIEIEKITYKEIVKYEFIARTTKALMNTYK